MIPAAIDFLQALLFLLPLAVLLLLAVGVLHFFRSYERWAQKSLQRRYDGLDVHAPPQPGDVVIQFHTYHGCLAWFTQAEHLVALPPDDARVLLGRLLRFNLLWGLVTPGAVFIPVLSLLNYRGQRKSVAAQEAEGGFTEADALALSEPRGTAADASEAAPPATRLPG